MKRKMKFHIIIVIIAFSCICVSCSKKIATEEQLYKYVRQNYGEATFIQSERTDTSLTCYFEDDEYLFPYWIKSKIVDFNMDGSSFFKYEEKTSNFENQYYYILYQYLQNSFDMMEKTYDISIYNIRIETGKEIIPDGGLVEIAFKNTEEEYISTISQKVGRLYCDADTRNYLKQVHIKAYDDNGVYLGRQNIDTNQYTSFAEEELTRFQLLAKSKDSTAKYQYLKTISLHEFAEMTQISIDKLEPQNGSSVTLYYFSTDKGVAFFIANVLYNGDCYSDYRG